MALVVDSFSGPYRWLSNFHPCEIHMGGNEYSSTEHAYQAMKCENTTDRLEFVKDAGITAGQAKRLGDEISIRPDWRYLRYGIMMNLTTMKYDSDPELAEKLCDLDGYEIIEGNTWDDTYWGQCPIGNGHNFLGRILMNERDVRLGKLW